VFGIFWDIYAPTNVCVKDIGSRASMVVQKCPHKIHLNTQCPPSFRKPLTPLLTIEIMEAIFSLKTKCIVLGTHEDVILKIDSLFWKTLDLHIMKLKIILPIYTNYGL
jgi:hypothetical protein